TARSTLMRYDRRGPVVQFVTTGEPHRRLARRTLPHHLCWCSSRGRRLLLCATLSDRQLNQVCFLWPSRRAIGIVRRTPALPQVLPSQPCIFRCQHLSPRHTHCAVDIPATTAWIDPPAGRDWLPGFQLSQSRDPLLCPECRRLSSVARFRRRAPADLVAHL